MSFKGVAVVRAFGRIRRGERVKYRRRLVDGTAR
jgi:hypothetical protein